MKLIIKMYLDGIFIINIAKQLKHSPKLISKILKANNIKVWARNKSDISNEIINKIHELAQIPNFGLLNIAKEVNLKKTHVASIMKKHNIRLTVIKQIDIDIQNGWKICGKCKQKKDLINFNMKNKTLFVHSCKQCQKIKSLNYRSKNKNKEKINKTKKIYIKNNKERINKIRRIYDKNRRNTIKGRLNSKMSSGVRKSLLLGKNGRSWESIVGYTVQDLENHLTKLFVDNMSWENVLNKEIQIDHILPKELFEYENEEDIRFKLCWSLSNLQPLWKEDNELKNDFLPDGRRARHLTESEKIEFIENYYKVNLKQL